MNTKNGVKIALNTAYHAELIFIMPGIELSQTAGSLIIFI